MPQHKSAKKRMRQNAKRRARNRFHRVRMRTMINKLRGTTDRSAAAELLNTVKTYLDRLAIRGIIHRNKAANYKSELEKHVNTLG